MCILAMKENKTQRERRKMKKKNNRLICGDVGGIS